MYVYFTVFVGPQKNLTMKIACTKFLKPPNRKIFAKLARNCLLLNLFSNLMTQRTCTTHKVHHKLECCAYVGRFNIHYKPCCLQKCGQYSVCCSINQSNFLLIKIWTAHIAKPRNSWLSQLWKIFTAKFVSLAKTAKIFTRENFMRYSILEHVMDGWISCWLNRHLYVMGQMYRATAISFVPFVLHT